MAGLPPGDPQLVSMIVSHLKTQGLFDQFRRECLADVDTKPAYLNLKQRVDNFVSNHLSNHTWSPHLNKNQLRNNIRQLVLQSGMLEQGVDRIVAQVVDPKINHIFRPQVERVVREFLSPGSCGEEPPFPLASAEMTQDCSTFEQASLSTPATSKAGDAMSILDTISSLNQEASSRASCGVEKGRKAQALEEPMQIVEEGEQDMSIVDDENSNQEGRTLEEMEETKLMLEVQALGLKAEDTQDQMDFTKEGMTEEVKIEEEELCSQEQVEESKDKQGNKATGKPVDEKQDDEPLKSPSQIRQRARERLKEEYSLEDSDLEGLSDITVSSVHTSDLSSFEEETDDEQPPSDSSDECEYLTDGERVEKKQTSGDIGEEEKECKRRRKAYVHKPFLYSRYYSDSDDEITVEERRRSAAKDKEERLLKRQQNRERMEEKRRQKATQAEAQELKKQQRGDSPGLDSPQAKEARKERKVLEKKMALSRKRKLDSRKEADVLSKKKGDPGGEGSKKVEVKSAISKTQLPKLIKKVSETLLSSERHRRQSGNVSEDSSDPKKLTDKSRTHSFILELEQGSQESLRQRSLGKFDRPPRKDLHTKERKEKERSLSDERAKLKQKLEKKGESQVEEPQQKEGNSVKATFPEERSEKKVKVKGDKKMSGIPKEGRLSMSDGMTNEGSQKDTTARKGKAPFVDAKAEKDKEREKDKMRERDRVKDKEKEKSKGEKTLTKSEPKLLPRSDFTGSFEDRSEMEPGTDGGKKKDKHPKEVLKRSKSHSEDRQGDKPKIKSDCKDNEREKTKANQEGQKPSKSSSENDKDLKRSKSTEKGRPLDKPKPKSREEVKTPSSSKMDKKAQSLEIKIKDVSIGKHEAAKEKKKEGITKELKKASEEKEKSQDCSQEKSEMKNAKKKLEKRDKTSEKKDESNEDRKVSRGDDKSEKSEKSSRPSFSPSLEVEEPSKKPVLPQDVSTDSDPVAATITTSFSDDTYDALSDITPEPEDGETELRLGELESRPLPGDADALLTLMDICTSADARLPHDGGPGIVTPEMTLQDADMKMKEAALTLLSMDPDSTLSSSLITPDARVDPEVSPPAQQAMDTTTAVEAEQCASDNMNSEAETKPLTADLPPFESPQIDQHIDEKPNQADASDKNEKEQDDSEVQTSAPQDDSTISNVLCTSFDGEKTIDPEIAIEPKPVTEFAPLDKREDEVQAEVGVLETSTLVKMEEDNQAKMDINNLSELKDQAQDKETVSQEGSDPQNIEPDDPDMPEEVKETKLGHQSTLVKQTSSASDSDRHNDEKASDLPEKEEKTDGRATRKRKHSSQKADSGEEKDDKESQEDPSAEMDYENIQEAKMPRRGRSLSKSSEVEEDQPKEPEKLEETATQWERHAGAQVKDATAGKKEDEMEEEKEENPSLGQQEPPTPQTEIEESGCQQQSQVRSPTPQTEGITDAESSKSKESSNSGEPSLKQKRSDEMEESIEKTQTKKVMEDKENPQQEQEERQPTEDHVNLSKDPEGKQDCSSENRTDNDKEDQGTAPKKSRRRGRPPKAAAAPTSEDSEEKKDKTSEEKESEQNDEEEDSNKKEEEETKTRTMMDAHNTHTNVNLSKDPEGKQDCSTENKTENDEENQGTTPKKPRRRGRPPKAAAASTTEDSEEKKDKTSEEKEIAQNDKEHDGNEKEEKETKTRMMTDAHCIHTHVNLSKDPEGEQDCSRENKTDNDVEDQGMAPKKPRRRGRPPKAAAASTSEDSVLLTEEKKDKTSGEKEIEQNDEDEEEEDDVEKEKEETKTRMMTHAHYTLTHVNVSKDPEGKQDCSSEIKAENDVEDQAIAQKKPRRRGRPPKAAVASTSEDSEEKINKTSEIKEREQNDKEEKDDDEKEVEETKTRMMMHAHYTHTQVNLSKDPEGKQDCSSENNVDNNKEDQGTAPKKPRRRGRPPKAVAASTSEDSEEKKEKTSEEKESKQNDEEEEDYGDEKEEEESKTRTMMHAHYTHTHVNLSKDPEGKQDCSSENKTDNDVEDQGTAPKKPRRRGRPPKAAATSTSEDSEEKKEKTSEEKESKQNDELEEDYGGEKEDEETKTRTMTHAHHTHTHVNLSKDPEGKQDCSSENKTKNDEEDQGTAPKKPRRRGRPPKAAVASTSEDSEEKKDKTSEEKDIEQNDEEEEDDDDDDDEEAKTRTTTRSASRLEAERNKPSQPSTRATRQNGKEEAAVGTHGMRGQAAATKGGRKREASPPAVRTRGAQKSEEPPSKRAKR